MPMSNEPSVAIPGCITASPPTNPLATVSPWTLAQVGRRDALSLCGDRAAQHGGLAGEERRHGGQEPAAGVATHRHNLVRWAPCKCFWIICLIGALDVTYGSTSVPRLLSCHLQVIMTTLVILGSVPLVVAVDFILCRAVALTRTGSYPPVPPARRAWDQ